MQCPTNPSRAAGFDHFRILAGLCLFFFALSSVTYSAEIVLIRNHNQEPDELQIGRLASFYGLNLQVFDLQARYASDIPSVLKNPEVVAVLVSQDALGQLNRELFSSALPKRGTSSTPVLIFGIVAGSDKHQLELWSNGAIGGCNPLTDSIRTDSLAVGKLPAITDVLGGWQMPAFFSAACALSVTSTAGIDNVLSLEGRREAPICVRVLKQNSALFFTTRLTPYEHSGRSNLQSVTNTFSALAPFIMFLSYAAGDYKWHLDGHYANLTIDDPWLTESYGYLNYSAVLAEMEQHNFHTTIAFVPWNFDRSDPRVIVLFREHPDRFSISVHGNNHIHQEFDAYTKVSLSKQITDIKQAVARMQRFETLTGIPYDRFMVFPHAVAPEPTFVELKRYNFLGTANSNNVPSDRPSPKDPLFFLRPYTNDYAGFLSLIRYSLNQPIPHLQIAIQCFLGNPLLFYGHQDLFQKGIDAFDEYADFVNHTQSDTHWVSLGELARHLYLIRRCGARRFEVRMFSNQMDLRNPTSVEASFRVEGFVEGALKYASVTIDGVTVSRDRLVSTSSLTVVIPPSQIRRIRIEYENDLQDAHLDVGRTIWRAWIVRTLSDFRDMRLSQFSWGRTGTRLYYDRGWASLEAAFEDRWLLALFSLALLGAGLWRRVRKGRQHPL